MSYRRHYFNCLPEFGAGKAGTLRRDVPARVPAGGMNDPNLSALDVRLRRLTLRSATGTAQRARPYLGGVTRPAAGPGAAGCGAGFVARESATNSSKGFAPASSRMM
jgi:hypothetical protein